MSTHNSTPGAFRSQAHKTCTESTHGPPSKRKDPSPDVLGCKVPDRDWGYSWSTQPKQGGPLSSGGLLKQGLLGEAPLKGDPMRGGGPDQKAMCPPP